MKLSIAYTLILAFASYAVPAESWTVSEDGWEIEGQPDGKILGPYRTGAATSEKAARGFDGIEFVVIDAEKGGRVITLKEPVGKLLGNCIAFNYAVDDLPLVLSERTELFTVAGNACIRRTVCIAPTTQTYAGSFEFRAVSHFPGDMKNISMPSESGRRTDTVLNSQFRVVWPLTSTDPREHVNEETQLAIPMLSVAGNVSRATLIADPLCTTRISLADDQSHAVARLETPHRDTPLTGTFTRTFWTVFHEGDFDASMNLWYATALADVPAGPEWLHDVAWQHYDYLSHGGKGWFEDLDAVEKYVAPADRSKIVFALHGWYDLLGRYAFDANTGKLDDAWMAFPNAPAMKDKNFPTSEAVPMTKAEVHRRIKYAKDRGVRVALYFADGLTACEGANRFAPDRVLFEGGWNGPDTIGKAYCQNPANPEVYKWYIDYLKALLQEYGNEIDILNWDETFMVRAGMRAKDGPYANEFAAPAMMRLVKELTQTTTAYRKDLAFMTSDCIGLPVGGGKRWTDVPPYAIMSHGTYQDSHSNPEVWPYGIFPNYRNVLWSCNWRAVSNFGWTTFGVENYDTPVATSNGWLDDKGIARLSDVERAAVLNLFNARKARQQRMKWLNGPAPVYTGPAPADK